MTLLLRDLFLTSSSFHSPDDKQLSNNFFLVFNHATVCLCGALPQILLIFGLDLVSVKADLFPLVRVVVSAAKLQPPFSIFVPSIAVPSRPSRSFWISQILPTSSSPFSSSLVPTSTMMRFMLNALHHGYACSESTSPSFRRPKLYSKFLNSNTI